MKQKKEVKRAKTESWEEFGREIEEKFRDNQGNKKEFWTIVKNLRGKYGKQAWCIKNEKGDLITEEGNIVDTWRTYYGKKFRAVQTRPERMRIRNNAEGERADREEVEAISEAEVQEAITKMKLGKSAGRDEISPEMIKYGGTRLENWIRKICQQAWDGEDIPKDWEENIIIPLHKKGKTDECDNYRAISLSSCIQKIYSRIIERRIRLHIEDELQEEQAAYRENRQTQDHIYALRTTIERKIEEGTPLYLAFVDLQAAFDTVPKATLWMAMAAAGIPYQLIEATKRLYARTKGIVRIRGRESKSFDMERGIKQGDSLSPLLFIIVMDQIIKESKGNMLNTKIGHWNMRAVNIQNLVFADDIVLIADTERKLQQAVNRWSNKINEAGMSVNTNKSKIMCINKQDPEGNINIECSGKILEVVNHYEYLGVIISQDGTIEQEIRNRISKATSVYYQINTTLINKRELSKETKLHLYKTIYVPTLTYGAESWPLQDKHKSRITAAEMRYLRRIVGRTRRDRVRNVTTREELETEPLVETIQRKQLRWYGHVVRMREERLPRKIMEARREGKRRRGRPRLTWLDTIKNMVERKGKSIEEAKRLARNRREFLKWTEDPTP